MEISQRSWDVYSACASFCSLLIARQLLMRWGGWTPHVMRAREASAWRATLNAHYGK